MRRDRRRTPGYRRRSRRRKVYCMRMVLFIFAAVLLFGIGRKILNHFGIDGEGYYISEEKLNAAEPDISVQLLDVNEFSRPGTKSDKITGIVIHYTANPGSTAEQNRNYFNGLKDSGETQASSHFVVGIDGEIVQCVPTWEIAYASNKRNHDTVSIECCHPGEDGKFTKETYASVIQLTAWLCLKFELTEEDVIRHYDVTGKNCPKYFVEHEDTWLEFKEDVKKAIEKTKNADTEAAK